jgi:hypothetical protein
MQRQSTQALGIGGALLAAAILAACGGGASSPGGTLPATSAGSGSGGSTSTSAKSGVRVTLKIDRSQSSAFSKIASKGAHPMYVSRNAKGLMLVVATSATSQTLYANISSSPISPLCTMNGSYEYCTLIAPTLGSNETITGTEVDQSPTGQNSSGYGTGFPSTSNILAVGSVAVNPTPGTVTNVSMGLSPVVAQFSDDQATTAGEFFGNVPGSNRIVVTGNQVLSTNGIAVFFSDAAGGDLEDPTPLPLVDVNGSPTPVTVTASSNPSSALTIAIHPSPYPSSPPAPSQTISIPDDSAEWLSGFFVLDLHVNSLTSPATIQFNNNLTALSQFTNTSYGASLTYNVDPVLAAPTTTSVTVTGNQTATVTGTDVGASGMGAESNYTVADGICLDSSGSGTDANVTSNGSISSGQQTFTINPVSAGSGTCHFYLYDLDTGVVSQEVQVTVNP